MVQKLRALFICLCLLNTSIVWSGTQFGLNSSGHLIIDEKKIQYDSEEIGRLLRASNIMRNKGDNSIPIADLQKIINLHSVAINQEKRLEEHRELIEGVNKKLNAFFKNSEEARALLNSKDFALHQEGGIHDSEIKDEELPAYCSNYPALSVDGLEDFYKGNENASDLFTSCYKQEEMVLGVNINDLTQNLDLIGKDQYHERQQDFKNKLVLKATSAMLDMRNSYMSIYRDLNFEPRTRSSSRRRAKSTRNNNLRNLRNCAEDRQNKDLKNLVSDYDKKANEEKALMDDLEKRDMAKQKAEGKYNEYEYIDPAKRGFIQENMINALVALPLFEKQKELQDFFDKEVSEAKGQQHNDLRACYEAEVSRIVEERTTQWKDANPDASQYVLDTFLMQVRPSARRAANQTCGEKHIWGSRDQERNEVREGYQAKIETAEAARKLALEQAMAPLYGKTKTHPLLFKRNDDMNVFSPSTSTLEPSKFAQKLGNLGKTMGIQDKVSKIMKASPEGFRDVLAKLQDPNTKDLTVGEGENKVTINGDEFRKDYAELLNAAYIDPEVHKLAKEKVTEFIDGMNESATKVCQNNGDQLHHFPLLSDSIMNDSLKKGTPEEQKKELIKNQAAYCQLLKREPPNPSRSWGKLLGGIGLVAVGTVIQIVPIGGNLAGLAMIAAGSGLMVNDAQDVLQNTDNKMHASIAAHAGGWGDYNKILLAAARRKEDQFNLYLEYGFLGIDTLAVGFHTVRAASRLARGRQGADGTNFNRMAEEMHNIWRSQQSSSRKIWFTEVPDETGKIFQAELSPQAKLDLLKKFQDEGHEGVHLYDTGARGKAIDPSDLDVNDPEAWKNIRVGQDLMQDANKLLPIVLDQKNTGKVKAYLEGGQHMRGDEAVTHTGIKGFLESPNISSKDDVYDALAEIHEVNSSLEWWRVMNQEEGAPFLAMKFKDPDFPPHLKEENLVILEGMLRGSNPQLLADPVFRRVAKEIRAARTAARDKIVQTVKEIAGFDIRTESEKEAIHQAYWAGIGKVGPDGKMARPGNFTDAQIQEKVQILLRAGFSESRAVAIVDKAISKEVYATVNFTRIGLNTQAYREDRAARAASMGAREVASFNNVDELRLALTDSGHEKWLAGYREGLEKAGKPLNTARDKPVPKEAILPGETPIDAKARLEGLGYKGLDVQDGVLVQDINRPANEIVPELNAKLNGGPAKGYADAIFNKAFNSEADFKSALEDFHKTWTANNGWQSGSSPHLFRDFTKLSAHEKLKDLQQFEGAMEVYKPAILDSDIYKAYKAKLTRAAEEERASGARIAENFPGLGLDHAIEFGRQTNGAKVLRGQANRFPESFNDILGRGGMPSAVMDIISDPAKLPFTRALSDDFKTLNGLRTSNSEAYQRGLLDIQEKIAAKVGNSDLVSEIQGQRRVLSYAGNPTPAEDIVLRVDPALKDVNEVNKTHRAIIEDGAASVTRAEVELSRIAGETVNLSPKQANILLTAHRTGTRNAEGAYPMADIRQKMRILEEGGFSRDQARALIRSGAAGENLGSDLDLLTGKIAKVLHEVWRSGNTKTVNFKAVPLRSGETAEQGLRRLVGEGYDEDKFRIVNGVLEQDIVQPADKIVPSLNDKLNGGPARGYADALLNLPLTNANDLEKMVDQIHKVWMDANSWAKGSAPHQFVGFGDLSAVQKLKDLDMLEGAIKVHDPTILDKPWFKAYKEELARLAAKETEDAAKIARGEVNPNGVHIQIDSAIEVNRTPELLATVNESPTSLNNFLAKPGMEPVLLAMTTKADNAALASQFRRDLAQIESLRTSQPDQYREALDNLRIKYANQTGNESVAKGLLEEVELAKAQARAMDIVNAKRITGPFGEIVLAGKHPAVTKAFAEDPELFLRLSNPAKTDIKALRFVNQDSQSKRFFNDLGWFLSHAPKEEVDAFLEASRKAYNPQTRALDRDMARRIHEGLQGNCRP